LNNTYFTSINDELLCSIIQHIMNEE